MVSTSSPRGRRGSSVRRKLIALVTAVVTMIGLAVLGAGTGVANASTGDPAGITSTMLVNGSPLQSDETLHAGDPFDLKVQYDNTKVQPGSTVTFTIGDNMTITQVPSANSSIDSVTRNGNQITVKFKSPLPPDVTQGVFDIKGTVNNPGQSGPDHVTWNVNSGQNSVPVTVIKQGDTPPPTNAALGKSVSPTDLNKYVHVTDDGTVTMDPTLTNQAISYTVTETVPKGATVSSIGDQLPSYLGYDADSFSYTQTKWDANGLNKTTTDPAPYSVSITGNSFTSSPALIGPTIVTIKYTAHVTDPSGLAAALQAQLAGKTGGTSYTEKLTNTATDNTGQKAEATVNATGKVPTAPCTGLCTHTLSKASSWDSRNVITDADGKLTPPQGITYTLKANVATTDAQLPANVVLSDPLPTGASWNTADAQFITASGTTLTKAADCPAATTFAGNTYAKQWCVDGQTLLVNLGNDKSTNVTLNVKALVNSVSALTKGGTTTIDGATAYQLPNTVTMQYDATHTQDASKTVTVVQLPVNGGGGTSDASVFSKTAPNAPPAVDPGASAAIPYVFKVGAGKGIDLTKSTITDFVDKDVFGNVDLGTLNPTGKYNGVSLDKSDFTLDKDADGNLVITLSDAGKTIVTAQGIDKAFELDLTLTTLPFDGKVTKNIANSASLTGAAGQPPYTSTATSTTTSYGSEAEVDKTLYDAATGKYTDDLHATTNGAATYVYKLDFIPHGGYDAIKISPVVDTLPSDVQFLGFVTADDAPTAANPKPGPVDIGGNLQAVYDATAKTVTIQQNGDTVLDDPDGDTLSAYFAVRVASISGPIVNSIPNGPTATIEPAPKVSVGDFVWVDANRDGRQDAGEPGIPGVVLTITGPDGKPVTDVNGNPVGPQTTDSDGKYSFDNLPVLQDDQSYTVTIDQDADSTKTALAPYIPTIANQGSRDLDSSTWTAQSEGLTNDGDRDPTLDFGFVQPSVSVGDYVWVDANHNGRQDSGEKGIPGVVLTVTGPDGKPVTDVYGHPVGPQTTDKDGKYSFDNLPALEKGKHYTVTIDQDASKEALAPYVPTIPGQGDRAGDSSTWTAESTDLPNDGDRDPTLDFGFFNKTYAVGDYTWIDTNKDGVQDANEPVLPGVGVTLLDGNGTVVGTTTTDAKGHYLFDNLPAGTYQVKFQLTPEQAAKYQFTTLNDGTTGTDSDANQQTGLTATFTLDDSNANLTTSYTDQTVEATQGIDPTWDAGVVVKSVSVGDYVWVDSNHNGRQDKGEKGIPGVVLKITGPDGKPVTDVNGKPVGPQTTDSHGKYSFDNLPALKDGQHYTVTIDREASKEALAPYVPTIPGQGDRAGDSSTWSAQSEGLTNDGDRDSTLDFGFVAPAPSTTPTPTPTVSPTGNITSTVPSSTPPLSYTGVNTIGLLATALLVLLGGISLVLFGRRRESGRMH